MAVINLEESTVKTIMKALNESLNHHFAQCLESDEDKAGDEMMECAYIQEAVDTMNQIDLSERFV